MGYWKDKVLPKIKKVFEKNGKKAAAAEACKSFDESKEGINKEFEEKKTDLQPKVVEIYEASSTEIKTLVKERNEAGVKKNAPAVHKFLEELVKIEFPGSKPACEASEKYGAALVSGPVLFVVEKVSTFITIEEKEVETGETSKDKEILVEEKEKKEEEVVVVVAEEKTEPQPVPEAAPTKTDDPPKETTTTTEEKTDVDPPKETTEPPKP